MKIKTASILIKSLQRFLLSSSLFFLLVAVYFLGAQNVYAIGTISFNGGGIVPCNPDRACFQNGENFSISISGGPANSSGDWHRSINGGAWEVLSGWINTDSSGNDTKGPYTCNSTKTESDYISWNDGSGSTTSTSVFICDTTPPVVTIDPSSGPGSFHGTTDDGYGTGFNSYEWSSPYATYRDTVTNRYYSLVAGSYSSTTPDTFTPTMSNWTGQSFSWTESYAPPASAHICGRTYEWKMIIQDVARFSATQTFNYTPIIGSGCQTSTPTVAINNANPGSYGFNGSANDTGGGFDLGTQGNVIGWATFRDTVTNQYYDSSSGQYNGTNPGLPTQSIPTSPRGTNGWPHDAPNYSWAVPETPGGGAHVCGRTYEWTVTVRNAAGLTGSATTSYFYSCVTPTPGQCGPAAKNYFAFEQFPYADPQTGANYCSVGNASPASPGNPPQGGSSSWTCQGINGGSNASCTATRDAPSDGIPPSCTASPAFATVTSPTTISVNITCSDTGGSGLLRAYVAQDSAANDGFVISSNPSSNVTFSTPATHQIGWWAIDGAGNQASGTFGNYTINAAAGPTCGTNATNYHTDEVAYPGSSFCSSGSPSPASPAFPAVGGSANWSCGATSCGATRNSYLNNPGVGWSCSGVQPVMSVTLPGGSIAGFDFDGDSNHAGYNGFYAGSASQTLNYTTSLGGVNFSQGSTYYYRSVGTGGLDHSLWSSSTDNVSCAAPVVNGQCGSSNGQSFYTAPSSNLCSPSGGTPTAVSGSGPWNWQCLGSGGGTNASCSANLKQDGQCGSANAHVYASNETGWAPFTQCTIGNPSSTTFPAIGGSANWTCSGVNGGNPSAVCSASRASPPLDGVCGPASTSSPYAYNASGYAGAFCSAGTPNPASSPFPPPGSSLGWNCMGSGGGANPWCVVSHLDDTTPPTVSFNPNGGTATSPSSFNITIQVTDNESGIAQDDWRIQQSFNGGSTWTDTATSGSVGGINTTSGSTVVNISAVGLWRIHVYARDIRNNITDVYSNSYTINNAACPATGLTITPTVMRGSATYNMTFTPSGFQGTPSYSQSSGTLIGTQYTAPASSTTVTFTALGTGSNGAPNCTATASATVDATLPTVNAVPPNGTAVNSMTVNLTANDTGGSGLDPANIRWHVYKTDNTDTGNLGTFTISTPNNASASVTISGVGDYKIHYFVQDLVGNLAQNDFLTYTITAPVDNSPPTVTFSPNGGSVTSPSSFNPQIQVVDGGGSHIAQDDWRIQQSNDGGSSWTDTGSSGSVGGIGTDSASVNVPISGVGVWRLKVYAHDGANNFPAAADVNGLVYSSTFTIASGADVTPPTITSVSTSSPACNTVRFSINGASDNVALHAQAYSFDGGTTWQAANFKDFTGTNVTLNAGQIKVRDTSLNVYTYGSAISGSSAACADLNPPTITGVSASSPACNTVRFSINGAADNVALHAQPYSFDGGSSWQASSFKDFSGTSVTLVAGQIRVRDTSNNTYTHMSPVTGNAVACADVTPPTITGVSTSSPACNTVRFTVNGAADNVALHVQPYSFDTGTTWQSGNTKDFSGTSVTLAAGQIKVRDAANNIYTHMASVTGNAPACPAGTWSGNVYNSAYGAGLGWILFGNPASTSYNGLYAGVTIGSTGSGGNYPAVGEAYSPNFGVVDFSGTNISTNPVPGWAVMTGAATIVSTGSALSLSNGTAPCTDYKNNLAISPNGANYGVCIDPNDGKIYGYAYSATYGWIKMAGNEGGIGTPPVNDQPVPGVVYQLKTDWRPAVSPITIIFTATPSTVNSGDSSTLNWTVTNATSCTASGDWSGNKVIPSDTESTGALLVSKTYTLTCQDGLGNSTSQTVTVTVNGLTPPINVANMTAGPGGLPPPVRVGLLSDVWFKFSNTGNDGQISFEWNRGEVIPAGTVFYYSFDQNASYTFTGGESTTSGGANYKDGVALNEGIWYFHVNSRNGSGTWGTASTFIVKYDTTAPTVASSSLPPDGEYNTAITITPGTFTDALSGIATVKMYFGNSYQTPLNATNLPTQTCGQVYKNCYLSSLPASLTISDSNSYAFLATDNATNQLFISRRYQITLLTPLIENVRYDEPTQTLFINGKNFGSMGSISFYNQSGQPVTALSRTYTTSDGTSLVLSQITADTSVTGVKVKNSGLTSPNDESPLFSFHFGQAAAGQLTVAPATSTVFPGDSLELVASYGADTAQYSYTWTGYQSLTDSVPPTGVGKNKFYLKLKDNISPGSYTVSVDNDAPNNNHSEATLVVPDLSQSNSAKYWYVYDLPGVSVVNIDSKFFNFIGKTGPSGPEEFGGKTSMGGVTLPDIYLGDTPVSSVKVQVDASSDFSGNVDIDDGSGKAEKPLSFTFSQGETMSEPLSFSIPSLQVIPTINVLNGSLYRVRISLAGESHTSFLQGLSLNNDFSVATGQTPITYVTTGRYYQIGTVILVDGKATAYVRGNAVTTDTDFGPINIRDGDQDVNHLIQYLRYQPPAS